jgi:hypothetical protein
MELLGDMGHAESHFGPFGGSASVGARGPWFVPNFPYADKSFWKHQMVLLGDEAIVDAHFGPFGDSVNLDAR